MKVQKTATHTAKTLALGEVQARETIHVCAAGCRLPSGAARIRRAQAIVERIPPRSVVGYDVLVWVGLRRYLDHRQRDEIRVALEVEHGVRVSEREVDVLAQRFLTYLMELHTERAPILRQVLKADGGWPLHVDATGEDGRGTLLVALAGWRAWVLGAWKIPTEREDQILPHLRWVCRLFGAPCAIVRDLGRAMIPATATLAAELALPKHGGLRVPVFSCHQHFLADVGKDLLEKGYDRLRSLLRSSAIRAHLRALVRGLGRSLGSDLLEIRGAVEEWLADKSREIPEGRIGLAVVRALGQWILDYPADSENLRFPFDRPYMDLITRARKVRRAVDALLRRAVLDDAVDQSLCRLGRTLDSLLDGKELGEVVQKLTARVALFDQLRGVLRLEPASASPKSKPSNPEQKSMEFDQIRRALDIFQRQLEDERPKRGPAKDERESVDVILAHLKRYADSLWGHAIPLPAEVGGGFRVVDRTNNILESRFRRLKQGERRRTGRKNLSRNFENLPAAAALATNLSDPDYVEALCGSLERLPAAFAALDAERSAWDTASTPDVDFTPEPIASAALPREDRTLVRSDQLQACIEAASRSRAPRIELSPV